MATIVKRPGPGGRPAWQALIRRRGYRQQTRTFDSKAEAQAWARNLENEMDRGVFVSRDEAEATTLGDLLDRYEREISAEKRGAQIEGIRIAQFRKHPLAHRPVASIRGVDIATWRDNRLKQLSPATV
ncbi:MAG: site-specific integrase, partial [Acidiferrobacterales bacterium]